MLYKVKTLFEDGTETNELVYSKTAYSNTPKISKIRSCVVISFRYKHLLPAEPILITSALDKKKYIVPSFQEVHPQTELSDIEWVRPIVKKQKTIFEVIGSTGDKYTVNYNPNNKSWKCTCQGFWRAKDRQCKHIKEKIHLFK